LLPEHLFACKIYFENNVETQRKILQKIYDTPIRGHPGISNTWNLVNCKYKGPQLLCTEDPLELHLNLIKANAKALIQSINYMILYIMILIVSMPHKLSSLT